MLRDEKLAILGVGKLGEAILAGLRHAEALPMDQVAGHFIGWKAHLRVLQDYLAMSEAMRTG